MGKRELLFVTQHLTIGGVQKSLVSALGAIDYDKYNVTLYVRKKRLDIINYIDKRVNVIVNSIDKHYYRTPTALLMQIKKTFFGILRNKERRESADKKLSDYISKRMMEDESRAYFKEKKYDIAIAYVQSITALFVERYINAEKKIVFYQGSTDEWHNVNAAELPRFDKVVVEHNDIKDLLLDWYKDLVPEQIYILANYTDSGLLKKQSQEIQINKNGNTLILCTCARFSSVKGIDIAVEAAKILKDKKYTFIWYLVGNGPEMAKIKSLVGEYDLSDNVKLMGMQKNPYPYMAVCDIYVQPSREEALSIAMLESQILCAPMVSTKTAGGLAMIQEGVNGVLSEINAESLSERIEELMVNKELRKQIKQYLASIDYTAEEERYRNNWKLLLGT